MLGDLIKQLRDNPRLRWGVALIAGIFWLYLVLLLRDAAQTEGQQQRAAGQSIARLRVQLVQHEWTARVLPARTLAVQLEGRLWQAPTAGLAQARFQDWLNAAMVKAAVTHPQIAVTVIDDGAANASGVASQNPEPGTADAATTPADLWKIKAKLDFDFSSPVLIDLLRRIEGNEKQIIVATLNVSKEPRSHVEMELYGYFQKPLASATKSDGKAQP